jgi:hypothetical protein
MTRFAIAVGAIVSLAVPVSLGGAAHAEEEAPKPAAKAKGGGKVSELDKLKGDYKWGMTPDEVTGKIQDRVRASYDDKLKKTANDPSRHDRLRKEMVSEVDKVKTKIIKFDGTKTGYDVSIIDQEFVHSTGESMLVAKEETATRYFFFKNDRLYKMFIAFDKEILQGKSFREFGNLMQARFGKAKEVTAQEKTKAGVKLKLDHYVWPAKSGDVLRLVDRSEFYDVYCLVIYDNNVAKDQESARQAQRKEPPKDNLIESVITKPSNERDPNDNVVDTITGKQVGKPGDQRGEVIRVPSVSGGATTQPASVTPPSVASPPIPAQGEKAEKPDKKGKKPARKGSETEGLAL